MSVLRLWPSTNFDESLCVLPLYYIPELGHQETSRVVSPLLVWPLIKDSKVLIGSISMVVNNCLRWIITLHFKSLRHKTPTPAHSLQSRYTYGSASYVYYTLWGEVEHLKKVKTTSLLLENMLANSNEKLSSLPFRDFWALEVDTHRSAIDLASQQAHQASNTCVLWETAARPVLHPGCLTP